MSARLQALIRDTRVSGVVLIALLLLGWQLSATYLVKSPTWPTVTRIFEAWSDNVLDGTIPGHMLATFWRQMLGYGLAIVLGVTLGLVMGYYRAFLQPARAAGRGAATDSRPRLPADPGAVRRHRP